MSARKTTPSHPTRKTRPWRQELFDGLPTDLQQTVDAQIDEVMARSIGLIEPMPPSVDEVKAFVQVASAPAAPGTYVFLWKNRPCCMVRRQGLRVIVSEMGMR